MTHGEDKKNKNMQFYLATRWIFPQNFTLRVFTFVFLGMSIPFISFLAYEFSNLQSIAWQDAALLAAVTLTSAGLTLFALHGLLAPLKAAKKCVKAFRENGVVPCLPAHLNDDAGQIVKAIVEYSNEVDDLVRELKKLSTLDDLSGLLNRRAFMKRASEEVARTRRTGSPLCVTIIDIDHFKRINDSHGHAVGDLVIKDVSDLLMQVTRSYDIVARLDGEEFVILHPGIEAEQAYAVAERIRSYVAYKRIYEVDQNPITISLGVTQHMPDEPWIEVSMARADKALYEAKQKGRNRAVLKKIEDDKDTNDILDSKPEMPEAISLKDLKEAAS
jgi:diguanylate cyclase (GGDEF)-like protein